MSRRIAQVSGLILTLAAAMAVSTGDLTTAGARVGDIATVVPWSANHDPALEPPTVDQAAPEPLLADAFYRYATEAAHGWTGGDSTFSLRLPDGRTLWMFSDTYLGPLNRDGTRPARAPLVSNTFVIQNGNRLSTVHGGTPTTPAAVLPPPGRDRWYWVGDGLTTATEAQIIFQEYRRTGPGGWDFAFNRNVLATFNLPDLSAPARVDPLPSASGTAWGAAILPVTDSRDGYTYIYGVSDRGRDKRMKIARVRGDDLRRAKWQYRTIRGWRTDEQAASEMLTGVANEFSVIAWRGHFLLVSQDTTTPFSAWITATVTHDPAGPFRQRANIYRTPETGTSAGRPGRVMFTYNAHAHRQFSSDDTILVSYNTNSLGDGPADAAEDAGVYRPRFVQIRLRRPNG